MCLTTPATPENIHPVAPPALGRFHARRLREIYRSAGWPSQDIAEIELLAAGMLMRVCSPTGHETLRVTDGGVCWLAEMAARNRSALSKHEALVAHVAGEMVRAGRIAWRGLSLRARLAPSVAAEQVTADQDTADANDLLDCGASPFAGAAARWCIARPDVFSIRNTTVEAYADPVVHEIKVHRSDLLGDLRRPDKRAAYLDLGGECWYVLGADAKGQPIGDPSEIDVQCGVMVMQANRLMVARAAPRSARRPLPFSVWLALAKATPVNSMIEPGQTLLGAGPADSMLLSDPAGPA